MLTVPDITLRFAPRPAQHAVSSLEHTQEATLDDIKAWSDSDGVEGPPIFWVWGMAGMGKSTIAQTVAEQEACLGGLGASFFFSRDTKEQSDPLLLYTNLAFQLSQFNSVYKAHLAKVLKDKPSVGHDRIEVQLRALLVEPLSSCKSLPFPIIIVVDALDESEPELVWKTIIRALATDVPKIQQKVKFLVTSRPENTLDTHAKSWKLHELGETVVSRDVERYSILTTTSDGSRLITDFRRPGTTRRRGTSS